MKKTFLFIFSLVLTVILVSCCFYVKEKKEIKSNNLTDIIQKSVEISICEYEVYNLNSKYNWGSSKDIEIFKELSSMTDEEFLKINSSIEDYSCAIVECKICNGYEEEIVFTTVDVERSIDDLWIYNGIMLKPQLYISCGSESIYQFALIYNKNNTNIKEILSTVELYIKGNRSTVKPEKEDWIKFSIVNNN